MIILEVLKEAMFSAVNWQRLGLSLGLYITTLDVISRTSGDANNHLKLTIQKWLEKKDGVRGTTWQILIDAVKRTGDNAAAQIMSAIIKTRNIIVETQDVEKGNTMPPINNYTQSYMH